MMALWGGIAILILFLPSILSSWTGFAIALGLSALVMWKAFAPKRPRRDVEPEDKGGE
jgi:hypothetical protein